MSLPLLPIPPLELLLRFSIDIIAVLLLVFGMYYRRRYDKELATAAVMFNVATFSVLIILSSVEFGVAAGFGLFAIRCSGCGRSSSTKSKSAISSHPSP